MVNKILVLGAGDGQLPLIKRAKREGWYTIVVSPRGSYSGFNVADKCYYEDISNSKAVLQIAVFENVDAVATDQTDVAVPVVDYVCSKLGLPHIDCNDIYNFQLKSQMRNKCMEAGIPTIPYKVVSSFKEATLFLESILPDSGILKPVDSQGSRGVHRVLDVRELQDQWNDTIKYSRSRQAIIEKYIDGQEIEVDTVIKEGKIVDVLIGDVFNFKNGNAFSAYERIYPSNFSDEIIQNIKETNSVTIQLLGMITGWTHGEYIVTREGEVYLLEVGARGGGEFYRLCDSANNVRGGN